MQKVVAVFLCMLLSSCAVFEGMGLLPSRSTEVPVSRGKSTSSVFSCVESTVVALSKRSGIWATSVTRRDEALGVIEIGNFDETNIIGFRVRAVYSTSDQRVRLNLKGAGPFYADPGIDAAMQGLDIGVRQCV